MIEHSQMKINNLRKKEEETAKSRHSNEPCSHSNENVIPYIFVRLPRILSVFKIPKK